MGSKFSKRQVVTKTKKTKTEKKQQGKSNSRNPGSTQSVNIYDSLVSSSPKQNNGNQYEDTQSLSGTSGNQRPVVLPEPGRSVVIPRTIQPPPPPAPCSPLPVVLPEPGRSVVIPRTIQPPPPAARIYKDLPDQACRIPRMPIKPPLLTNEQTQNPIKDVPEKESDYLAAKRNTQVSTSSETDDESNCIVTKTKPEISTDPQLYDDSNCIITETKPEIPTAPESDTDSDDYDYIHPGELSDRINIDVTKETDISEFHQPDCKQEMRADITSESNNESVIRDILQLIKDGEDKKSHFVKNLRTGEENFVPKAGFTKITKVDVKSLKCFFEKFDRQAAQERLLGSEIEIGTYLLRPSTDGYALSLRCKNKRFGIEIRHYKIRANDKGEFYIDAASNSKTFSNIVELISYYTENPGLRCNLKDPLPRDIPLSDFIVKFSDFELGKILGSGNFGYVHAGTLRKNGQVQQVAVKSLKGGGSMTMEEFRKEAETMQKLRHPNLVTLLGICENSDQMYIITEKMSRGSLLDLLRGDTGKTIKFNDLMDMAIQVVDGMCYLEKMTYVHRDLRADNVLVGDGNKTKIADFGMARLLESYYGQEQFFKAQAGSVFPYKWTAPEAVKQKRFTVKSDVWSFGILLYEMVTYGDEPYAAMTNHDALDWVEKGNRLRRPTKSHCPVTLYTIMKNCWLQNSSERPNFADIKETLKEIMTLRR